MTLLPGPAPGATAVTVWTLEMHDRGQIRPARDRPARDRPARERRPADDPGRPLLLRAGRPAPELSRFFYETVGRPWHWVDRLGWTDADWLAWVDRPEHHLWSCWLDGVPAGYVELEEQPHGEGRQVEIAYFGLLPGMTGQGLGGPLLTHALTQAWALPDVRRVWVHTCSLDGPAALANYEARGLVRCGQSTQWRMLPDAPPA